MAFVHDWLVTYRGGERVLEALLGLFPAAPVYTLFYSPAAMPASIRDRTIRVPGPLNRLRSLRKALLPLLPAAIRSLRLPGTDLVISTSSCVAKGVTVPRGARHLCYIHSPMRYVWDRQAEYVRGVAGIPGAAAVIRAATPWLRRWDVRSSSRVDRFVANSRFVADQVSRYYLREATVVPPPVDVERFRGGPPPAEREGYFLAAGAFVSYKRFDLAIDACEAAGRRLVVAGSGPMEARLRARAGPGTRFEIAPTDHRLAELLRGADAFLFPGIEDFGILAIEAMASGTPVVAFRAGGALDFMEEGRTGLFFDEPDPTSLAAALLGFDRTRFDPDRLRAHALSFGREPFLAGIRGEIERTMRRAAS